MHPLHRLLPVQPLQARLLQAQPLPTPARPQRFRLWPALRIGIHALSMASLIACVALTAPSGSAQGIGALSPFASNPSAINPSGMPGGNFGASGLPGGTLSAGRAASSAAVPGFDAGVGSATGVGRSAGPVSRGPAPGALSRPLEPDWEPREWPWQPNDFQRFVPQSTGRWLTVHGANLFAPGPATFAPIANAPVPAEYVIGPGDELLITLTGVLDSELRVTVDRNGQIVLPKVGPVSVAGQKLGNLTVFLTQQVSRSFRNFTLTVSLGQLRSIDIYVVGAARQPGRYTVSSLSTLINALFTVGGPGPNGSMRRIELVRSGKTLTTLDLYEFVERGDTSRDSRLLPGDVIVIPPVGDQIAIMGAVNQPAIVELPTERADGRGRTLGDVLGVVGKLSVLAQPKRVVIERLVPAALQPRRIEEVALDTAGLATRLRAGDLITAVEITSGFANAVTLRGAVAQPLRHPYRTGMTVRDLIPEREALVTRDYYRNRNALVQFESNNRPGEASLASGASGRVELAGQSERRIGINELDAQSRRLTDEVNWDYAVIERFDPEQLTTKVIPFQLGRAVLHSDPEHNLALQAGDVVTIFSKGDIRVPQGKRVRLVRLEGEIERPGLYPLNPGETLTEVLGKAGGLTAQAYPFGLELERESVRLEQQKNLNRIVLELEQGLTNASRELVQTASSDPNVVQMLRLQSEAASTAARDRINRLRTLRPSGRIALGLNPDRLALPPLPLEDNDRVIVPATPGFVSLLGAVRNESALIWQRGNSLGDYLNGVGLLESANEDEVFVVRADGSLISKDPRTSWLTSPFGLDRLRNTVLMPGDTIVVPDRIPRETGYAGFMRGLKDWTQVFSQLGLGAAAIRTLQ